MTWTELAKKIAAMTPEQQSTDVTVFDSAEDEYFPVQDLLTAGEENDVLDENHPYLRF